VTGWEVLAATLVMAIGGALQASIGFGSLLVAAPVVALIDIDLVPAPTAVAGTALVLLIAYRERRGVDRQGIGWVLAGRVPGTLVGGAAVGLLPETGLQIVFGVLLLVAVGISARTTHLERTPAVLASAGLLSGVMGTATSVGGPPIALVYQREEGPVIRGTLSAIFVVGSILTLVTLAAVGELGADEWVAGLVMTPGIVLGFLVSRWTIPHVDGRALRPAVLGVSGAAALVVLVEALV